MITIGIGKNAIIWGLCRLVYLFTYGGLGQLSSHCRHVAVLSTYVALAILFSCCSWSKNGSSCDRNRDPFDRAFRLVHLLYTRFVGDNRQAFRSVTFIPFPIPVLRAVNIHANQMMVDTKLSLDPKLRSSFSSSLARRPNCFLLWQKRSTRLRSL